MKNTNRTVKKDKVAGKLIKAEFDRIQEVAEKLYEISGHPGASPENVGVTMALDLIELAQEILAPVCEPEGSPRIPGEPRPTIGDLVYAIAIQPDGPLKLAPFAGDFTHEKLIAEINDRYNREWHRNAVSYCGG